MSVEADAAFPAWVWDPAATFRGQGFSTARLLVFQQRIVMPNRIGARLKVAPIEYTWPVVVVERHRPLPDFGVLVDIGGRLGRVQVRHGSRGRLAAALRSAGFVVLEVDHWGWEGARPVSVAELGTLIDQVPPCVVRR